MGNALSRVPLLALTFVLLAATLATLPGAQAGSTPNYSLLGYVEQAGGGSPPPVPAGVTVDLISGASHQTYATATASASGQFTFNSANTGGTLAPGWWGVWVPPQAKVTLFGQPYAVLPSNQNPQYYWENSTSLTTQSTAANPVTITGVSILPYNATVWGNASYQGHPVGGATVELLDPTFNGFVLASNTTVATATNSTVVGEFSLPVPWGSWVLETIVPGSPPHYSVVQANISASTVTINPVVGNYLAWGFVNQASNPNAHVPAGGNVTVFDPTNGLVYSAPTPAGGFYSFGTYPVNFAGPGAQTFDVVLSPVGWQTESYQLSVSSANPTGGAAPKIVYSTPQAPPASYATTLNFSAGFGKVNVSTSAVLGNDSTFPDLANASIGQLWGQLALDWQHNLSFSSANLPAVFDWINSSGPFFPAGQNDLTVNGTGFGQPTNDTFVNGSTCASFCGLTSSASMTLGWKQTYNATATIPGNAKSYTISFVYRHPTAAESINYTVVLPTGYVLTAGSAAPPQSRLAPNANGTWTSFTLVSQPSSSAASTATFTVVKYSSVTANVNITAANFAFSKLNVINATRGSYAVVVGVGENATFSALNSTFPSGNNGTEYAWDFGDGTPVAHLSQPTTYHTYATAGQFTGSLTLTSSGGQTSSVPFTVYTDDLNPAAVISTNATGGSAVQSAASGGAYLVINSSTVLHFNASASSDQINSGTTQAGIVAVASWNISTGGKAVQLANYSSGAGADPKSNLTFAFQGAGSYLTNGTVNGTLVPVLGWQYNLSLQVWDGAGHRSVAYLVVLVRDHQKPAPVIGLYDSRGRNIGGSGIVEGTNGTAAVTLSATNSTDPHNGSIVRYQWKITDTANSSVNYLVTQNATAPSFKLPTPKPQLWLPAQSKAYTVNLTVTDRANQTAYTTATLSVTVNTTTRPVIVVANLTAPSSMTGGSSYTVWVNVTDTIGKNSTCQNLAVRFYLLAPSGSGSGTTIGGTVQFYTYVTNTTINGTAEPTPLNLVYNKTVRAQTSFSPSSTGSFDLWANATCSNEFSSDYRNGANTAHVGVTLNPNPIVQIEEIVVGVVIAAAAIALIVFYFRRSRGGSSSKGAKSGAGPARSGLERGKPSKDDDDEE